MSPHCYLTSLSLTYVLNTNQDLSPALQGPGLELAVRHYHFRKESILDSLNLVQNEDRALRRLSCRRRWRLSARWVRGNERGRRQFH